MIRFITGNILDAKEEAILVPVNCEGVAGAGLAKQFKDEHPYWYMNYHDWCSKKQAGIGKLHCYRSTVKFRDLPKYIISFPTKTTWRKPSHVCYILCGLEALVELVAERDIKCVAVPWLGCGLGGLHKGAVRVLFMEYLRPGPVEYVVYGYKR